MNSLFLQIINLDRGTAALHRRDAAVKISVEGDKNTAPEAFLKLQRTALQPDHYALQADKSKYTKNSQNQKDRAGVLDILNQFGRIFRS